MVPPRGRLPSDYERSRFGQAFPLLRHFSITGEVDSSYDCVGLTVNPGAPVLIQPPAHLALMESNAAIDAFYKSRFMRRVVTEPSGEVECVALFADAQNLTHVALRSAEPGWWESKLGPDVRIMHPLSELEGGRYGRVVGFFVREDQGDLATSSLLSSAPDTRAP